MGMFSFMKEVGEKLFGGGKTIAQASNEEVATALTAKVKELGLDTEGMAIAFENGQVTLKGNTADQETREKIILAVGNNEGIAAVNEEIVIHNPTPPARFYTVVKGDNLSKISKAHYGDANKYNKIFEANKPMLSHPDKIYPGQVLRIPD